MIGWAAVDHVQPVDVAVADIKVLDDVVLDKLVYGIDRLVDRGHVAYLDRSGAQTAAG